MSWQDKLRKVEPYVAGEQPKIVNMIKDVYKRQIVKLDI